MKLKEAIALLVTVAACLFLLGSLVSWRWGECRKVGHGVAYCVFDMGRG